jgi:hypothetical protein
MRREFHAQPSRNGVRCSLTDYGHSWDARFFLVQYTKTGKKHTKRRYVQYIPDSHKIFQMAIKYTNIFHCKTLQYVFTQSGIFGFKKYRPATLDHRNPTTYAGRSIFEKEG